MANVASFIAVHGKYADSAKYQRFWEMYWGVLGMVENEKLESAMVQFGNAIAADESRTAPTLSANTRHGLEALEIAHACRTEMKEQWSPKWGYELTR